MALVGSRLSRAAPDDFLHALVGRDLPVDGYGTALPVESVRGSGINRVQRTTPLRVGSPDATPAEKGSEENPGVD